MLTIENDFVLYNNSAKSKYLLSYLGNAENITLPTPTDGRRLWVRAYAFAGCKSIKSVTVSEATCSIDRFAFYEAEVETLTFDDESLWLCTKYTSDDGSSSSTDFRDKPLSELEDENFVELLCSGKGSYAKADIY